MSLIVVGVADGRLASEKESVLATYALGSCIAVAIHDPVAGVAGMLHFMLPDSSLDSVRAKSNPWMFADTGIPLLFRSAYELGAQKRRLSVWAAGGAQVMNDCELFHIGKRNCLAMRKILWRAGVLLAAEDVGGTESRTVRLELSTGRFLMRGPTGLERQLGPVAAPRNGVNHGL